MYWLLSVYLHEEELKEFIDRFVFIIFVFNLITQKPSKCLIRLCAKDWCFEDRNISPFLQSVFILLRGHNMYTDKQIESNVR